MRQIILDTETTGLSHKNGDRIIEICCLEIIDYKPTGKIFHSYINPRVSISWHAQKVHGITNQMLKDKPSFKLIMDDFLDFIKDDDLIAHNAKFDLGFIHKELSLTFRPPLKNLVIDTLFLSKIVKPKGPCSLDAMLSFFKIKHTPRETHNAIDDCKLLAAVYYMLTGGKQEKMFLKGDVDLIQEINWLEDIQLMPIQRTKLITLTDEEEKRHGEMCKENNLWKNSI